MSIYPSRQGESGVVLVSAVIMAALGAIMASGMLFGAGSQIASTKREVQFEKAFFIAEAGVERTKASLRATSTSLNGALAAGVPSFGALTQFGEGNFQVQIFDDAEADGNPLVDTNETVIVCSTGTFQNVSRVIEVGVRVISTNFPPASADGAVGVYGTNSVLDLIGAALIDGQDYLWPTNFDCNGVACAGSITTNAPVPAVFSTEDPDINDPTKVTGDIITNGTSQFADNYWQDQAEAWIPQAAITLNGGSYVEETLGTRTTPLITVVTANQALAGNTDGAGVLIVMEGVNLELSGNLHYEGVVILMGNNEFNVSGTVRIFGSVTTASGADIRIQGTPEILYSSIALANLRNLQMNPRPIIITYWREIK